MSAGDIVTISEDKVGYGGAGWVDGENVLIAQINRIFNLVDGTKLDLDTYMEELKESISAIELPDGWADALGNVVINDVGGLDPMTISPPGDVTLPGFEGVYFPIAPVLKPVPTLDTDFVEPTAPSTVNPSLGWVETPYTSDMWLDLFTKVRDGIVNGGTGLGADAETAMLERDQERKRVANEQAFESAVKNIVAKGLRFPALAIRSLEQRFGLEVMRQNHASSNEIFINMATLAQEYGKFAIEKGLGLEQLLRSTWEIGQRLSLDAKKAAAELILTTYAEQNKAYIAQWDGFGKKIQAQSAKVELVISENKLLADLFKVSTDAAIAETEQIAKERDSLVSAHEIEARVYESKVKAVANWYNALTENQKAQLQKSELELQKVVNELRLTLDGSIASNSLKEKIIEGMSNLAAQVLASALNAFNTSVGHSTSSSRGVTEHWGHSEGLNESHNTDHAAT